MPENIVYMPKDAMSSFGDVIVPCQISKGSLPSVQNSVHKQDEDSYYCSDISIQISMDSATTIAQFSQSVVGSNPDYEYGDQISLILGQQFNENDIPHTQFSAIEITLDQSDSRLLSDKAKDNAYLTCFSLYNGYLSVKVDESAIPQNMTGISPVWIHSRDGAAGNILVSTQYLYDCNPYTDAHDTALESYGFEIAKKKFLEPDEIVPPILTDWKIEGNSETHNQKLWYCGELGEDNLYHIKVNNGFVEYDIKLNEPLRRAYSLSDSLVFGYKNLLPIGYKKCKYLELDGNSYFNSNVKTKSDIGMTIKFSTSTVGKLLIGARKDANNSGFIIGNFNSNGYGDIGYGGATANVDYGVNVCDGNIHTAVLDSTQAKIDDTDLTFTRGTIADYYNIYIGTWSNRNSADSHKFIGRIYNVTLYDSISTLFYGIPCLDDNDVPCLYDLVSKKAIYKTGSGTITYEIDEDIHEEAILIRPLGTYTFSNESTFYTKATQPAGTYRYMCNSISDMKLKGTDAAPDNIKSPLYETYCSNQIYRRTEGIGINDKAPEAAFWDSVYSQSANINAFKEHLNGMEIVYERAVMKIEVVQVPLIIASPNNTYTQTISQSSESVQWYRFYAGYENIYTYGVMWHVNHDMYEVVRIGNKALHASLPIQSQIKGCLLNDNGEVTKYLTQEDWNQSTLGDETHQVMLELPEFWWKFTKENDRRIVMLSTIPINGYTRVPKMYVSPYEATVDRGNADGTGDMSTWKLASVKSNLPRFRGGNNNSSKDGAYNTQLKKPATMIPESDFRVFARRRKPNSVEWNCYTYQIHKIITWLFVVEYANRNSQRSVNNALTDEGYHQGGLGVGTTNADKSNWESTFGSYPFVPIGQSDSLGNGTGEVAYDSLDGSGNAWFSGKIARYRGLEHPFGHILKISEGIHIEVGTGENGNHKVYICENPIYWNNDNNIGYTYIGDVLAKSNNSPTFCFKDIIFDNGDIMPVLSDSTCSSDKYFYDQINADTRGNTSTHACMSSSARTAQNNGLFSCNIEFPNPNGEFYGTRLCFIPNEQA